MNKQKYVMTDFARLIILQITIARPPSTSKPTESQVTTNSCRKMPASNIANNISDIAISIANRFFTGKDL